MQPLTQNCLGTYTTFYACKLATMGSLYYKQLNVGHKCADSTFSTLSLATMLLELIKDYDLTNDECLTNKEVCGILDKLHTLVNNKCNCSCS